ncbi:superoxide dismutase, Cu-Zn family [Nonomuraea maritima]|uniref:Superoxide dismutase, Cu-Zn family n=1 Tax=Nonomuraea maritima TaxID=683260 RepID=A0A1G8V0Z2_9ACTN|nr:superoxide dismutase family protein [Nonomuraea maritima]SDJ59762.1 superoxide dismutase, Cu-Zn family [Nonomuraea maritima]
MRVPALLLILLTAACAAPPGPVQDATGAQAGASPGESIRLSGAGEFAPGDTAAIVYDRKLAPEGAQASATVESSGGKTRTSLVVEGLLPERRYGAHLHAKACGKKPDEAGPHYQHQTGQVSPASEVWLDFTTDAAGAGRASARNNWALSRDSLPGSLVIHAGPTVTEGPQVGQAGARVACLTLTP